MKSSEYRLSETNEFLFSPIYFEKMRLRRERDLWVPFFAVPFFFARRGERAGGDAEVNINCGRPYGDLLANNYAYGHVSIIVSCYLVLVTSDFG